MPFWSRKSKDPVTEDAQQTLHRLQAEAARESHNSTSLPTASESGLRLRRGGYAIDEVDAFLATIDSRPADEIRGVQFNAGGRKQGYNEDDVDQLLDLTWTSRAAQELKPDH